MLSATPSILKRSIISVLNENKFNMKDEPLVRLILDSGNHETIMDHLILKLQYIKQREVLKDFHLRNFNKFRADTEIRMQKEELSQCLKVIAGVLCQG